MKKYNVVVLTNNIFVSRTFPTIDRNISRVTARIDGWEREIPKMKREILKEARLWGFK